MRREKPRAPLWMYVCMYNFAIQINRITIHDKKGKKNQKRNLFTIILNLQAEEKKLND